MALLMTAALSMVVRLLVTRLRIMLMTGASRQAVMVVVVRIPAVPGITMATVVIAIVRKVAQRTHLRRMKSLTQSPMKNSVRMLQTAL